MPDMLIVDKSKPETVTVELPSYPGSVITMLKRIPLQQGRALQSKYPKAVPGANQDKEQAYSAGIEQMIYAIKEWNLGYEAEDGTQQLHPIDKASIEALFSDADVSLIGAILQGAARHTGEGNKWEIVKQEEKKTE